MGEKGNGKGSGRDSMGPRSGTPILFTGGP